MRVQPSSIACFVNGPGRRMHGSYNS